RRHVLFLRPEEVEPRPPGHDGHEDERVHPVPVAEAQDVLAGRQTFAALGADPEDRMRDGGGDEPTEAVADRPPDGVDRRAGQGGTGWHGHHGLAGLPRCPAHDRAGPSPQRLPRPDAHARLPDVRTSRAIASGSSPTIESSRTSAASAAPGAGGTASFGMRTTVIPAARPDRTPLRESSTTSAFAGSTPSRSAARR